MFLLLLFSLFSRTIFGDWSTEFDNNQYLDGDNKYHLYWTKLNDSYIEIGIECESAGWVGFGISAEGFMTNSDIAFGWVGSNGVVYLQDRHVEDSHVTPLLDTSQDLKLIEGSRIGNVTKLRFIRPIKSCDSNDTEIVEGTSKVIYSWNSDNIPDVDDFDNTVQWHGNNRGSKSVNFLTGTTFNATLENNTQTFDISMASHIISTNRTTYFCRIIELPVLDKVNHVTKFAPIITEGNEDIVHHIVISMCPSNLSSNYVGTEFDCFTTYTPCSGTPFYGWAIGGEEFTLPSNVGFELSGNSGLQYVMMQVHYDNENHLSSISDSSGIRIYYTPTLREYNASTLEMGILTTTFAQFLPAGESYLLNTGYCPSQLTNTGIPSTGTYVFGTVLHAHLHGVAISLRQIRNGVELPPIDSNWNYDFNYQATTAITNSVLLLPNDTLILDCYYDTTDSNHTIYSGVSTSDEMCLVFMYVYPAMPLTRCASTHKMSDIDDWAEIAYEKGYLTNPDNYNNYDMSLDGALEWYNMLWDNYTERITFGEIDEEFFLVNITIPTPNEYIAYNVSTKCIDADFDKTSSSYYNYYNLQYIMLLINVIVIAFYF